jgi:hypothetical protein
MAKPMIDDELESDSQPDDTGDSESAPAPEVASVTKEELDKALSEKKKLGIMGAIADNLSNRQSFGNAFLRTQSPHVDASAPFRMQQGLVDQGIKNKEILQQQALKAPEIQLAQQANDPDSEYSKAKVSEAQAAISGLVKANIIDKEKGDQLSESLGKMNGFQASKMMESNPLLKQSSDIMKNQALIAMAGARLDQGNQRIAIQKDNQAAGVANVFDKDPNIQKSVAQRQSIQRGQHTIENVKTLTPQLFNEIQLDIANALSGGKAAAVSTQSKVEFETAAMKMADLKQRLSNRPEDIGSPEVKAYIQDVLSRLDNAYAHNISDRAQQLSVGRNYANNPSAQQSMAEKVKSLMVPNAPEASAATSKFDEDDQAALQWAKQNPNDPKAVKILMTLKQKGVGN